MRARPWPSAREYCKAIEDPKSFARPELRNGTLESTSDGAPKAYAGTFATTFRIATARGDLALRCFTRGEDERARRYAAIDAFLRYVRSDALYRTEYVAEAIRVNGTLWPAVIMDWIPGRTLDAEIALRIDAGDALLALAAGFREVVRSLGALGIAHGDLQHGNIIVSRGAFRLIDYDAMYLPALADLPQAEFGHRNYQHPQRRSAPFDGRLDRFSAIVIYTSLVALAADPALWARFHDGENLLFRAHDFTSAGRSDLFRALLASNATSGLAGVLYAACGRPVTEVPTLEEAIRASAGTMPARVSTPPPRATPRPTPRQFSTPEEARLLEGVRVAPTPGDAVRARPPAPPISAHAPRPARRGKARGSLPTLGLVALMIALAGLAMGLGYSVFRRGAAQPLARMTVRRVVAAHPGASPRVSAFPPVATQRVTLAVAAVATHAPTPRPTSLASIAARATPAAVATPSASPATPASATAAPATSAPTATASIRPRAHATLGGPWQISEANRLVGTIVWSGNAALSAGDTIVLDLFKANVAGQAATPCERRTSLHAAIAIGVPQQSVPYRETNCAGTTSSGEIRVTAFSPDAASFSGTVWTGGQNIGEFTARKE